MSQAYRDEMILSHKWSQLGYCTFIILLPKRNFGFVLFGNNMSGTNAAANVLAYHLIDETLGIPLKDRVWLGCTSCNINPRAWILHLCLEKPGETYYVHCSRWSTVASRVFRKVGTIMTCSRIEWAWLGSCTTLLPQLAPIAGSSRISSRLWDLRDLQRVGFWDKRCDLGSFVIGFPSPWRKMTEAEYQTCRGGGEKENNDRDG